MARALVGVVNGRIDIGAYEVGSLKVLNMIVSGASSTHAPFSFDTVDGAGTQLKTVPVGGADTISIVFSEDVDATTIDKDSLKILGLTTANQPTVVDTSFAYNAATDTASWQFEGWSIHGDNYLLKLSDTVIDVHGASNNLDGEWTNPKSINTVNSLVSEFPSGNGVAGGDFEFVMTLLPGDANLDGEVNFLDYSILSTNWQVMVGQLFVDADFNGDGAVDFLDFSILSTTWNRNLQSLFVLADLDGDLKVENSDRDTVLNNQGMPNPAYEDGDLDGDGDVDTVDLAIADLQLAFGVDFNWVA